MKDCEREKVVVAGITFGKLVKMTGLPEELQKLLKGVAAQYGQHCEVSEDIRELIKSFRGKAFLDHQEIARLRQELVSGEGQRKSHGGRYLDQDDSTKPCTVVGRGGYDHRRPRR